MPNGHLEEKDCSHQLWLAIVDKGRYKPNNACPLPAHEVMDDIYNGGIEDSQEKILRVVIATSDLRQL
jgi:hypothetical protein